MPQAPDVVPSLAPTTSGVAGPSLAVPVDAFGGAVGHALQSMGTSLEQDSDKIWQRAIEIQNTQNETQAKDADAKYMMQAGVMNEKFKSLQGTNAGPDALGNHIQQLQDLRTSLREKLNPAAARMYDGSSLSNMGSYIRLASGYSATQGRVAANGASQARIDQMSDGIGSAPTDELTYQRFTRGIAAETRSQGQQNGWEPEQTEETVKQNISTANAKRIVGLAKTDAIGAQAMFDRATKSGDLLPVIADKVQATVQTQFRQQGSRIISDRVLANRASGDEAEKTEQEYIDDGMKAADEIAKRTGITDPLFKDFVKQRIMADYGQDKRIERDTAQAAEQTVAGAMLNGNKEGILPKSVDELRLVDPAVGAAWDTLKPTTQKKYMHEMALNALGHRVSWNDENLKTYRSIKGQATDNPTEFLARDVVSENIPASAKRELINLQQRLTKQSTDDPRVARAMSLLAPDLNAAGITRGTASSTDRENYYQFVGGLQDALEQYQGDHPGKVPSAEEVKIIGAQLMQEHATGRRGWMFFDKEQAPTYKLPVSDEDASRIRNLSIWNDRGIAQPTNAMIQRYYHAEKFKELYGKSAKKPEATP